MAGTPRAGLFPAEERLGVTSMLGAFRSAHAGPRGAAARVGLAALLACIGLTWTAGATSAFATYGTVKITKATSAAMPPTSSTSTRRRRSSPPAASTSRAASPTRARTVHANAGAYDAAALQVSEPANDKYELKSIVCSVTPPTTSRYGSADHVARHARGRHQGRRRREGRLHVHQPAQDRHHHRQEAARPGDRHRQVRPPGRRQERRDPGRQRRLRLDDGHDRHAHRRRGRREPGRLRRLHVLQERGGVRRSPRAAAC